MRVRILLLIRVQQNISEYSGAREQHALAARYRRPACAPSASRASRGFRLRARHPPDPAPFHRASALT